MLVSVREAAHMISAFMEVICVVILSIRALAYFLS